MTTVPKEYVQTPLASRNRIKYCRVEIYWPSELLKHGVELIDTAGLNENENLNEIVNKFLPDATSIICIANDVQPTTMSLVNTLKIPPPEFLDHVFFVLNLFTEEDLEEKVDFVRMEMSKIFPKMQNDRTLIHAIPLRKAFQAASGRSGVSVPENYDKFLKSLIDFIGSAFRTKLWRCVFMFQRQISTLNKLLDSIEKASSLERDERKENAMQLKILVEEAQQRRPEFLNKLDALIPQLDQDLQLLFFERSWSAKDSLQIPQQFSDRLDSLLTEFLKTPITNSMKQVRISWDLPTLSHALRKTGFYLCSPFTLFADVLFSKGKIDLALTRKIFNKMLWNSHYETSVHQIHQNVLDEFDSSVRQIHQNVLDEFDSQIRLGIIREYDHQILHNLAMAEIYSEITVILGNIRNTCEPLYQKLDSLELELLEFSVWNLAPKISDSEQLSVGEEIGQGGFGKVFRGTFKMKEGPVQPIAIKTINFPEDPAMRKCLLKEILNYSFLSHPNVVQLKSVFLDSSNISSCKFMMELCKGNLWKFMPKVEQDKIRAMLDVAQGLQYLHKKHFFHRDLKLENLLVASDGTVKIGDLGASQYKSLSHGTQIGTRGPYMAPEMLTGEDYDESIDVFAFGLVMIEIWNTRRNCPGLIECHIRPLLELVEQCRNEDDPKSRPKMPQIVQVLTEILEEIQ